MADNEQDQMEETEEMRRKRKQRYIEQMERAQRREPADNPFAQGINPSKASEFLDGFRGGKKSE